MDVGDWLRSVGLEQYERLFREHDIDVEVLHELTDGDLEKIGLSLGHRKRLLKAVAATAGPVISPPTPNTPVPLAADAAERRQLTVMFCDLVGSTSLSARLDPEDMRDVIRAYQDVCSGAVARYDGFVAKFMGDGVLAYFGFPRAHEEDAERAVKASLDIAAVVGKLETPATMNLQVRIGIATGVVVVGDLVGHGSAQERAVVGDTPNLAARLQSLAEPGSIVIAESTRRLLGATFELAQLGPQLLKGFDAPVPAWSVLRQAENVSRFEASRSQGMTPFVGREHEVALLLDRWRDAIEGEGQVVVLSGEAGIGKSRILAALRERIGDDPHLRVRYQCSPHHANDAFYPITSQIWHAAGFVSDEQAATRLDKLEAMIARSGLDPKEIGPLLAALLSIRGEERYAPLEMAPSEQKERTIAALISLLEGLTKDAPVLALLEDAHWIDPTSLDVFGRLVDRLTARRILLVIAVRPEFAAPWVGRAHVASIQLGRFARRQVVAMVDRIVGSRALPPEVLEQIIAKTDGVPLFVEELTKTVLESGLLREENGSYVLDHALSPLAIPSTLQDSLAERLDRLAPVKEIAQIGAVIGREFSYRLLEAVSPIQGQALQGALDRLIAAELVHGRGEPPEATYVFKHALVQETAYVSMLRNRRQRIHAEIARAMEQRFADQIESAPAIVAHHYAEAGLSEPAVRSWLAAAEVALSRSANAEADRHVEAGLALIPRLAEGSSRQSLELGLQLARANSLFALKGFNSAEAVAALTEAKRLLDAGVGSDLQRFSVLHGLWAAHLAAGRIEPGIALAREIVAVAARQDETTYLMVGHRLLATMLVRAGQNREALVCLEQAERYRDPSRHKLVSYRFANDPSLLVLCYKIWALLFLGFFDRAIRVGEQVRRELVGHGHAPTVAACNYLALALPKYLFGDFEACEQDSAEFVAYCAERKLEQLRLWTVLLYECARAMRNPSRDNIAALRIAIDAEHQSGTRVSSSLFVSQLAQAELNAGNVTKAEAALRQAFALVEDSGERFWLADLHRLSGQVQLKRTIPEVAKAEACFLKAIKIARSQEARLLELRAATDLAGLWHDLGSRKDPRALLEPILAAIEGGEDARDVRNAHTLLESIG